MQHFIRDDNMALEESDTHSFIVRIWKEEGDDSHGGSQWRGHITHAFTKHRRYLGELGDILVFMRPYLRAMGVRMRMRSRLVLWMSTLWRRNKAGIGEHRRGQHL